MFRGYGLKYTEMICTGFFIGQKRTLFNTEVKVDIEVVTGVPERLLCV